MIIYLNPTDLLITKEMQVITRVNDPDAGNNLKEQITMLPCFDVDTLPFIAFSGHKTLNILNIKTQNFQPLVDAKVVAYPGQQAFFFKKESKGYTLQFVSETVDDENKRFFNWHIMALKDDFFENLKVLERLPKPSVQAFIKEIEEHEKLKREHKKITKKNKKQAALLDEGNSKVSSL